jgi:hypothetical protein
MYVHNDFSNYSRNLIQLKIVFNYMLTLTARGQL